MKELNCFYPLSSSHAKINYSNQTISLMIRTTQLIIDTILLAMHCLEQNKRGAMHIYQALKLQVSISHWQTARESSPHHANRSQSEVQVVTRGNMLLIKPSNMRPKTSIL